MKVKSILGGPLRTEQEQPTPLLCLPRCSVGLEYEWEGVGTTIPAQMQLGDGPQIITELGALFDRHNDGSLRGRGCEFVFKGPYSGTKIIRAVELMDEVARRFGFEGSYRTSLHCHLDMQDVAFPVDIEKFGAVYCLVEPFFYRFVGNSRDVCNYCTPWFAHPQHFETYFSVLRGSAISSNPLHIGAAFRNAKQYKYSGLNFFSLGDFGTVEFRQAPVTMQKDKIITWINLIMRLKQWVQDNHKQTPESLVTYANKRGPALFLQEVFQDHYREVVRYSRDIYSDFKTGLNTLYQFVAVSI